MYLRRLEYTGVLSGAEEDAEMILEVAVLYTGGFKERAWYWCMGAVTISCFHCLLRSIISCVLCPLNKTFWCTSLVPSLLTV